VTDTLAIIRQAFREESMSCAWVCEWRSPNSSIAKKARHVKSKANNMLINFFDIKGTVQKEFILAVQMVNSAYCCDILW
jgi:hypothetical protein